MGKYGAILEDFYAERTRILDALARDENRHVIIRLIGALAFRTHCPSYGYIQDKLGRKFTDFDFVSYPRFVRDVRRVLTELGYEEDKQVTQLFGDRRMLFHDPAFGRHADVFFNVLDFCHTINFVGRLEAEELTVPLAELLLEKMQIVNLNEKDVIDTVMLLREHQVGDSDSETINSTHIANLTARDWGLWKTLTTNLTRMKQLIPQMGKLLDEDRKDVLGKIDRLLTRVDIEPKSSGWKMRAKIGEKKKWYRDVEELGQL